jgi:hypothetical protein
MEVKFRPVLPAFDIGELTNVGPYHHIMLTPVTETGSCVREYAEPEQAVEKNVKELSELLDSTN